MRDLTDKELALAPTCCDMYFINRSDFAVYVNSETKEFHASWLSSPVAPDVCYYGFQRMRPLKPFDITQHEWSSGDFIDVFKAYTDDTHLHFFIAPYCHGRTWINKSDAIAIAKHFKLTAEDLK